MGLAGVAAMVVGAAVLLGLLVWANVEEDADRAEHAAFLARLEAACQLRDDER